MLPTKLRSERCANDLNHFQLKVPSGTGTFSIAEIGVLLTNIFICLLQKELCLLQSPKYWRKLCLFQIKNWKIKVVQWTFLRCKFINCAFIKIYKLPTAEKCCSNF